MTELILIKFCFFAAILAFQKWQMIDEIEMSTFFLANIKSTIRNMNKLIKLKHKLFMFFSLRRNLLKFFFFRVRLSGQINL